MLVFVWEDHIYSKAEFPVFYTAHLETVQGISLSCIAYTWISEAQCMKTTYIRFCVHLYWIK
jgi:hypothetical protein